MNRGTEAMRQCQRCGVAYSFEKSSSALKLTYCGIMCEQADLGFTIEALEKMVILRNIPTDTIIAQALAEEEAVLTSI